MRAITFFRRLADIKAQLAPGDQLLVVADNCSDDTAAVASMLPAPKSSNAMISPRFGKGYALDWGVRHLSADPPSIVVIIDADCRLSADTVDQLVRTTSATGRPVTSPLFDDGTSWIGNQLSGRRICLASKKLGPPSWTACHEFALPAGGHGNGLSRGG